MALGNPQPVKRQPLNGRAQLALQFLLDAAQQLAHDKHVHVRGEAANDRLVLARSKVSVDVVEDRLEFWRAVQTRAGAVDRDARGRQADPAAVPLGPLRQAADRGYFLAVRGSERPRHQRLVPVGVRRINGAVPVHLYAFQREQLAVGGRVIQTPNILLKIFYTNIY